MSAKIFSHFLPLPSPRRRSPPLYPAPAVSFAVRFYLAGQFTRHDIHTGPLQILPLASHRQRPTSSILPLLSPLSFFRVFIFFSFTSFTHLPSLFSFSSLTRCGRILRYSIYVYTRALLSPYTFYEDSYSTFTPAFCTLSFYPPFADMFDGQNAPRETRIRRARASLD